jgi:hypothetical protein
MTFNDAVPASAAPQARSATLYSRLLAGLALTGGLGAAAASSCCVIPLVLGSMGAGAGIFSGLEALSLWRAPLLGAAVLAVAGAWGNVVAEATGRLPIRFRLCGTEPASRPWPPRPVSDRRNGQRVEFPRARVPQAHPVALMGMTSILTCPACGHRSRESMPMDACQFFFECKSCAALFKPRPGHCCVFCSFGDTPCPPVQDALAEGASSAGCLSRCCAGVAQG